MYATSPYSRVTSWRNPGGSLRNSGKTPSRGRPFGPGALGRFETCAVAEGTRPDYSEGLSRTPAWPPSPNPRAVCFILASIASAQLGFFIQQDEQMERGPDQRGIPQ